MSRIEFQIKINAPVEAVYQISQDYAVRYDWDPFPERIAFLDGATKVGKGVRVLVMAKSGLKMEVEFVQVSPPTTAAIKMVNGPFFLRSFSGSWIFKALSDCETDARFVYSIRSKWWALPWLLDRIAAIYFARAVRLRMHGLKEFCEAQSVSH